MHTVNVHLQHRPCPITIRRGGISTFAETCKQYGDYGYWIIITQPNLADRYGNILLQSMRNAGLHTDLITIPAGETAKSIQQVETLYSRLVSLQCDRSTMLIALGGGVVGDVAGFLAATYMRGIQYIQFPTTLLSMIDSAIGGKTGVNLPEGKNLVGAIYQPNEVVIDPDLLTTLPMREKVSGFAEMMKYGLIQDRKFFYKISGQSFTDFIEDDALFEESIIRSCEIKADIVSVDEFEKGLRKILNFGHTVGHALEILSGMDVLRHGEAVAFGMLCGGYISFKRGLLSKKEWQEIESAIRELPLPKIHIPKSEDILKMIRHDKKTYKRKRNFILLHGIGNAVVDDKVSDQEIIDSLEVL